MNMKIPENIKKMWCEALRSGVYKQHRGGLANDYVHGFCCLGVLCDLAVREGITEKRRRDENGDVWYGGAGVVPRASELPIDVQMWANIGPLGLFGDPIGIFSSLAELNDSGASFHEIAKIIEERF